MNMNSRFAKFLATALMTLTSLAASADGWHHGGGYHYGGGVYYHGHYGPRFYGHAWYGGHWYHGWYGGRPGWWWLLGSTWFLYPDVVYPYPDPNVEPIAVIPAPPAGQNSPYWYWCGNPAGYYPYISRCLVPWQAVAAGVAVASPSAVAGQPPQQQYSSEQPPLPEAPPPQPPGTAPSTPPATPRSEPSPPSP